jgi:hypothetical protein
MDNLENRIEQIQSLFHESKHEVSDQVIFSLFSCFSPDELCKLYIDKLDSTKFRHKLQQHIILSLRKNGSEHFLQFIDRLFELLYPYKSQRSIWINALLYKIIDEFPISYIEKYFDILLNSHRENDKYRAYVLAKKIWDTDIESLLWSEWDTSKSEHCLKSLIECGSIENLQKHFFTIWSENHISSKTKRNILFRVSESDFKYAEAIQDSHPVTYLYCAVRIGRSVSPEKSYNLALESETLDELGIAIWCLGQLGYWKTILELNSKIPELVPKLKGNEGYSQLYSENKNSS